MSADSTKVLFHILTLVRSTVNEDGKSALSDKCVEVFKLACDYLENVCSFQVITLENNETMLASCFNILTALITDRLDLIEKDKRVLRCALKILEVLDQALHGSESVQESIKPHDTTADENNKANLESNSTYSTKLSSEETEEKTVTSSFVTEIEKVSQTSAKVLTEESPKCETSVQTQPPENELQESSDDASSEIISSSVAIVTPTDLGLLNILHEQVSAFLAEVVLLLPADRISPILEALDSNKEVRLRILAKTLRNNFPTVRERVISMLNLGPANLPTLSKIFSEKLNS